MVLITHEQNEYLISYMKDHSEFAAHRFLGINGNRLYVTMWKKLADTLNTLGPERPLESWMWYWPNLKSATRFHFAELNRQRRKTGNQTNNNNEPKSHILYDKVKEVIGDSHKMGQNLIPEVGMIKVEEFPLVTPKKKKETFSFFS